MSQKVQFKDFLGEEDEKGIVVWKHHSLPSSPTIVKKKSKELPLYPVITKYEEEFKDKYFKTLIDMTQKISEKIYSEFDVLDKSRKFLPIGTKN